MFNNTNHSLPITGEGWGEGLPLDLLRYLVLTYSNEGDTILDNTCGSGTTCVAAFKEKRHFIGFELSKEYYEKALQRIKRERQQLSLF